ncbi:hypothetical protein FPOAC2_00871 [Fusarium poae]
MGCSFSSLRACKDGPTKLADTNSTYSVDSIGNPEVQTNSSHRNEFCPYQWKYAGPLEW